jgi:hypothetical protein
MRCHIYEAFLGCSQFDCFLHPALLERFEVFARGDIGEGAYNTYGTAILVEFWGRDNPGPAV